MVEHLSQDEKRRLVASRSDWFHSIDVGDGIVTPGASSADYLHKVLDALQLPADMHGLRVLDIGAYDGFFSFECERRGAEVVAIDVVPDTMLRLELARRMKGSQIRFQRMSVYKPGGGCTRRYFRSRSVPWRLLPPASPVNRVG